MPQSLARVLVHLVFSTHGRVPSIPTVTRPHLHAYLAGTLRNLGCPTLQVGGTADHVHLLFALARTRSIADTVEAVKTSSSRWMKTAAAPDFSWQAGYGAFSVSESQSARIITYIRYQEGHHRRLTFQDELRTLLIRYGVAFDDRYVWD